MICMVLFRHSNKKIMVISSVYKYLTISFHFNYLKDIFLSLSLKKNSETNIKNFRKRNFLKNPTKNTVIEKIYCTLSKKGIF